MADQRSFSFQEIATATIEKMNHLEENERRALTDCLDVLYKHGILSGDKLRENFNALRLAVGHGLFGGFVSRLEAKIDRFDPVRAKVTV